MDTITLAQDVAAMLEVEHSIAQTIVDRTMDEELGWVRANTKLKGQRAYGRALEKTKTAIETWATTDLSDRIIPVEHIDGSEDYGVWTISLDDMADWISKCRWGYVVVGLLAERKRRKELKRGAGPRPQPSFHRFAQELREEIDWIGRVHRRDNTGQGASDLRSLGELLEKVRVVSDSLGYGKVEV